MGTIAVVPMSTFITAAVEPRIPVRCSSKTVGTGDPLAFGVVTSNGSMMHPGTDGSVTLQMNARPFGPLLLVTMSGCAATIAMLPRMTVPLLLITSG